MHFSLNISSFSHWRLFQQEHTNMARHCINSHSKPQTDQKQLLHQLKGTCFCNQLNPLHLIIQFLPRNSLKSLFTTICCTISRTTEMTSWRPGIFKDFSSVAWGQYGSKTNKQKAHLDLNDICVACILFVHQVSVYTLSPLSWCMVFAVNKRLWRAPDWTISVAYQALTVCTLASCLPSLNVSDLIFKWRRHCLSLRWVWELNRMVSTEHLAHYWDH